MFVRDIHMDCRDPTLAIHCYNTCLPGTVAKSTLFNSQNAQKKGKLVIPVKDIWVRY